MHNIAEQRAIGETYFNQSPRAKRMGTDHAQAGFGYVGQQAATYVSWI